MKAGIYVRVSTSLQEERTSPDTQEARCRLAAEQAGYEFGPALTGLEQDAGRVVTLAGLLPARTMCSSWSRSSASAEPQISL